MTEFGAVAAGATVGGASGKAVSDGMSTIFGKVNEQTVKAASKGEEKVRETPRAASVTPAANEAIATDAPASTTGVETGSKGKTADRFVPPPPAAIKQAPRKNASMPTVLEMSARVTIPFAPFTLADALPAKPIPPPPTMTVESFKKIALGMRRSDVLKLGEPASRVAMFEDSHMVEMFSYRAAGERFGRLRLEDGVVVNIETN